MFSLFQSFSLRRPSSRFLHKIAPAAFLSSLLAGGPADAQELIEGTLNVQRFNPGAGPRNFITTRGARTDGEHAFSAGVMGNFGSYPFIVALLDGSETKVLEVLAGGDFLASYTPIPQLQFGLRFPLTYVKGHGINPLDGQPAKQSDGTGGLDSFGISDPELEIKYRFYGEPTDLIVFGVAGFVTAPLGKSQEAYVGTESVGGGLRAIADLSTGPFSAAVNFGYRYKEEGRIGTVEFGPEGFYGVGAGVTLAPIVRIVADIFGATQFGDDPATNSLEVGGGFQVFPISSLAITLGAGTGLATGSVGVPALRAFAGVTYINESQDPDGDGISGSADQCPTDAEDVDGYEDADGCPDLDNDGDGMPDAGDKCPKEPEDYDGFQDKDGCPDPDNDGDGIPDVSDTCADEPETTNSFQDNDGCPDATDRDSDGIPDDKDKCPEEPEDTDGFQDVDGCPDPDNDGDGIPDDRDECIDEPEDMNGTQDEDGCPEG